MNRTRSMLVVLALLVLALPVITGASSAPEAQEGVGDANASLLGAHLEVEDLDGLTSGILGDLIGELGVLDVLDTSGLTSLDTAVDLGLLEGLTTATTRDTPDARAALSPLRIGDDRPHDVSAGPGESTGGDAVVPGPLSALVPGLGLSAFGVSADADDDGAIARIDAVDATLDALSVSGLDIGLTGVVSEVTRTGASATQDLTVDGLVVGLGDILPPDLLEALPLDALLDLITELGDAGLLSGVDGLQAEILGLIGDIEDTLAALDGVELGDLESLDGDLIGEIEGLLGALDALDDLDLDELLAASSQGDVQAQTFHDSLGGLVEDSINDVIDGTTDTLDLGGIDFGDLDLTDAEIQLLEDTLNALLGAGDLLEDVLGDAFDVADTCLDDLAALVDDPAGLEACVNEVIGLVTDALDTLLGDVLAELGLDDVLDQLLALVNDLSALDELLGLLPGLIDQIAGLDLLTADTLGLEVLASADAEGGSTTIACELGGLAILGEVVGDTSCTDGSLDGNVDGAVGRALGTLTGVLESLPGVSGISGLSLDILPVADEGVTTAEDGTVTARAHAVLLELNVPSVTIDPDPSALLDDLLALDLSVVSEVVGEVNTILSGVGLDLPTQDLVDEVVGLLEDEVLSVLGGTVDGLLSEVTGLLDGILDLDILDGLLVPVSTPAINLLLDPVSEATFTPTGDDDSQTVADPGDDPVPGDDDSELPRTGGGIALLGLLAMLGALGLRRTG